MRINLNPFPERPNRELTFQKPPCLQIEWEIDQLVQLYIEKQPQVIVDIGTNVGGTLLRWIKNAPMDAQIISIDNLPRPWEQFKTWARPDTQLYLIEGASQAPATLDKIKSFGIDGFDWVFIDGDHHYVTARQDFELYGARVRPGGIIALHDIVPHPTTEVPILWREIQQAGYLTREIVADPHGKHDGYGIGVVFAE